MKLRQNIVLLGAGLLLVVPIVVLATLFVLMQDGGAWMDRLTAEAPATVTEVRRPPPGEGGYGHVAYSYEVSGEIYRSSQSLQGPRRDIQPGTPVKACYDPEQPREGMIVPADYVCGTRYEL